MVKRVQKRGQMYGGIFWASEHKSGHVHSEGH